MEHKIKILFVEDVPADVELAERILHKEGIQFQSLAVDNEANFIRGIEEFHPEIIVSDYSMPNFDGMKALKIAKEKNPDIPFILLTGSINEDTAVTCLKAGAVDYIIKEHITRLPFAIREALQQTEVRLEKEKAVHELSDSEKRFRTMIEMNHDGILIVNKNGIILFVNSQAEILLAARAKNLLGMPFHSDLIPGEFTERNIYEAHESKGTAEVYVTEIVWEEEQVYLVTLRDITERKRAEEELLRKDRLLNLTGETAKVGGWEFDAETLKSIWTDEVYRIHEVDFDFNPNVSNGISFYAPVSRPIIENAVQRAIEFGEPYDLELEFITAKGKHLWVHSIGKAYQENGKTKKVTGSFQDITQRKLAEEELRTVSSRNEALLASVPDIIMEVDNNKVYTWGNKTGLEFFGDECIGKEAAFYFEGEQKTYSNVQPLFNGSENIIYVESWQRRKDGEKRLLAWWCKVLKDQNSNVTGALSTARDITERKHAEEALKESEEKFRTIFNNSSSAMAIIERDTTISMVNKEYLKIGHYTNEDVIGLSWTKQIHPEDIERLKEYNRQRLIDPKNAPDQYEFRFIRNDGVTRYGLMSVSILPNINNIICSFIDITDRKVAEEALTFSEIRYRTLFESAKDGILILDAETGKIVDVNPFLIKMLGYSKAQFIDKSIWEIGFLKDIVANKENFLELQQKEYIRYEDLPLETIEGKTINVEFVSNVYLIKNKKVIQCNIRDITERKVAKDKQTFTSDILEILNRPNEWQKIINDILTQIKIFSGLEAIAIRLKDGEDYPYFVVNGFPTHFVESERFLCSKDSNGEIIYDSNGKPCLECMCGNIISKRTDPSLPFFTKEGSFWSNDTTKLLATATDKELQTTTRNRCNKEGYESVALIPLKSGTEIFGLLQLNDKRTNRFTLEIIQFYEEIGVTIGIALKRMQAERQIKESEERFRSLYENSTMGLYRTTPDGIIILANDAIVKMLGYSSFEELAAKDLDDENFDPTYDRKYFVEEIEKSGEVIGLESVWIRKDGTAINIRESAKAFRDANGKTIFYDGTVEDITERKRAEEALVYERNLLTSLMDTVPDQIYFKDNKSRFIKISKRQCEKYFINDPMEAVGKTDFDFFSEEHANRAFRNEQEIMRTGNPLINIEEKETWPDGKVTWVSTTKVPMRNINGDIIGTFGISRDITERKIAEEKLLQQLNELRRWHEVTLGREDRNMQLKTEVNKLLVRLGEPIRYPSQEKDASKD